MELLLRRSPLAAATAGDACRKRPLLYRSRILTAGCELECPILPFPTASLRAPLSRPVVSVCWLILRRLLVTPLLARLPGVTIPHILVTIRRACFGGDIARARPGTFDLLRVGPLAETSKTRHVCDNIRPFSSHLSTVDVMTIQRLSPTLSLPGTHLSRNSSYCLL